jgi:hypothetical protein
VFKLSLQGFLSQYVEGIRRKEEKTEELVYTVLIFLLILSVAGTQQLMSNYLIFRFPVCGIFGLTGFVECSNVTTSYLIENCELPDYFFMYIVKQCLNITLGVWHLVEYQNIQI